MRVISGSLRGKKLTPLEGIDTRPTLDRIKESIFDIIQFEIENTTVLDLFAGSGQLAIEALSRGAKKALLFEQNTDACKVIKKNIESTNLADKTTVVCGDYQGVLKFKNNFAPFDIVFLDPPYNKGLSQKALCLLADNNLISKSGIIVVETSKEEVLPQEYLNLKIRKIYNYGKISITIYHNIKGEIDE